MKYRSLASSSSSTTLRSLTPSASAVLLNRQLPQSSGSVSSILSSSTASVTSTTTTSRSREEDQKRQVSPDEEFFVKRTPRTLDRLMSLIDTARSSSPSPKNITRSLKQPSRHLAQTHCQRQGSPTQTTAVSSLSLQELTTSGYQFHHQHPDHSDDLI
jgi:hypothetical protein